MYKEIFLEDRKKLVKATFYEESGDFTTVVEKKRGKGGTVEIKEPVQSFKIRGSGRIAVYFCGKLISEETLYSGDIITLKGFDIKSYEIDPSSLSQWRRDWKVQKDDKKRKRLGIID